MKTSLFNMHRSLLTRGLLNTLILSTIALFLINPSQHTFAKQTSITQISTKQTSVQRSNEQQLLKQGFKDFCTFYYHDGKDNQAAQDTQVCQRQSSLFASLMLKNSPQGGEQWPALVSLHDLAKQNLLQSKDKAPIQSQQGFADSITNSNLKALISGSGNDQKNIPQDPKFLPTLWDFKLSSTNTPNPTGIPRSTPPQQTPPPDPASSPQQAPPTSDPAPSPQQTPPSDPASSPQQALPANINVTCSLVITTVTCTVTH